MQRDNCVRTAAEEGAHMLTRDERRKKHACPRTSRNHAHTCTETVWGEVIIGKSRGKIHRHTHTHTQKVGEGSSDLIGNFQIVFEQSEACSNGPLSSF